MKKLIKIILRRLLGIHLYETLMGTWHLGYVPHIKNPRTFNEKILNRKVYKWKEIPPELVDKYAVRDFVCRTIGSDYLNKIYGVYKNVDEIDFSKIPESFVIKATHGSQMNIIVSNRQEFNESVIRDICTKFLLQTYGTEYDELWYTHCSPRLIVEQKIVDTRYGIPIDFKFFVFHGRVEFIQVDFDRFVRHSRSIFDRNWTRQAYSLKYPLGPDLAQPTRLTDMIAVAERLGAGFDFIRVDLYSPNDREIVFGEMTFAPGSGWEAFLPENTLDFEIGKLWRMP